MECKETFAKKLVELREERKITQQQLADDIGITRQSLSLYEKAERTINIELFQRIVEYFNVSADYMLGLSEVKAVAEDIQTVSKVTGLSEESINGIIELKKIAMGGCSEYSYSCSSISVLNMLIKSPLFFNFMLLIADLNVSTQDYVQKVLSNDSEESIIEADKNFKVMLFEISKEFQKLIEDCYFPLYISTEKVYRELYRSCHHGSDTEVEKASEEFGKLREIFLKMEDERLEQIK